VEYCYITVIASIFISFAMLALLFGLTISVILGLVVKAVISQRDHLVILSHGLSGNRRDLTYLSNILESAGCVVLKSASNEYTKSFNGVEIGGRNLVREIEYLRSLQPQLNRISFVGNSLGGLYARFAIQELFDNSTNTMQGLVPHKFMTIATPHLGVRDYTFLDEYGLHVPAFLKTMVSKVLGKTGEELLGTEIISSASLPPFVGSDGKLNGDSSSSTSSGNVDEARLSLLYRMATKPEFLNPLRAFEQRRLFANLNLDFMVPLGTAAFLSDEEVANYRSLYSSQESGVVATVHTEQQPLPSPQSQSQSQIFHHSDSDKHQQQCSDDADTKKGECNVTTSSILTKALLKEAMRAGLDSCGWQKVIVNFSGFIPLAHNKIAALTKYTEALDRLLGFTEGRFVMDEAAEWLLS